VYPVGFLLICVCFILTYLAVSSTCEAGERQGLAVKVHDLGDFVSRSLVRQASF